MRVIPVLDLMAGRAVRANQGRREAYAPARSVLVPAAAVGDPLVLARAFQEALGCEECYVADLDAITGASPQRALVRALAHLGGRLLVDGGISAPDRAEETLRDGAARVVVGLETLPSLTQLAAVAGAIGPERLVFSLDLRDGVPVVAVGAPQPRTTLEVAAGAVAAGVRTVLVLDLARVGTGRGVDLGLLAAIRGAHPTIELLAGGGIASARDVERLAEAGCDGALVASALHDGAIGKEDIEAVRRRAAARRGRHASDSR